MDSLFSPRRRWRIAYRSARLMNYGQLHSCFPRPVADQAKESADFRRPLHGGHRDFRCPPPPLSMRLHFWKHHGLRLRSA